MKERAVEKAIEGKPYRKGRPEGERKRRLEGGAKGTAKGRKCKRVGRKGPRHAFRINCTARFPLPAIRPDGPPSTRSAVVHPFRSRRPSLPVPSVRSGPEPHFRNGWKVGYGNGEKRPALPLPRNGQLSVYTASVRRPVVGQEEPGGCAAPGRECPSGSGRDVRWLPANEDHQHTDVLSGGNVEHSV